MKVVGEKKKDKKEILNNLEEHQAKMGCAKELPYKGKGIFQTSIDLGFN